MLSRLPEPVWPAQGSVFDWPTIGLLGVRYEPWLCWNAGERMGAPGFRLGCAIWFPCV